MESPGKKETASYAEHVLDLFMEVLHKSITIRRLQEVDTELTPALAQGLEYLFRHEVCSVRDIAQGLSMTYSAASQLTERLVRKGWATRKENEKDRRLSEIRLTERGQQLVETIRAQRVSEMTRILERMDPIHRGTLVASLEDFIAASIEDGRSAINSCSHCGRDHLAECVINEMYKAATGMPIEEV